MTGGSLDELNVISTIVQGKVDRNLDPIPHIVKALTYPISFKSLSIFVHFYDILTIVQGEADRNPCSQ